MIREKDIKKEHKRLEPVLSATETKDGRDVALKLQQTPESLRVDVANLISLSTVEGLTAESLDVLRYDLAGVKPTRIAKNTGMAKKTVDGIRLTGEYRRALAEAKRNLSTDLLTASDIAMAAEGDVLREFAKVAVDPTVDLAMRHMFGSTILEYRAKLLKALPMVNQRLLPEMEVQKIMDVDAGVKEKMLRLQRVEPVVLDVEATG